MRMPATGPQVSQLLDRMAGRKVPGIQYVVVDRTGERFRYAGGWADVASQRPMTAGTTMMAFSMTKTVTAIAVLQLVEGGSLYLDDGLDRYVPETPYRGRGITIRHLLTHTSGIPNPIPLRWVHLVEESEAFDEEAALAEVLRANSNLASSPGERYRYSNIGYWLLGKIIERATESRYVDYVRENVRDRLGIDPAAMDFSIPDPERHANGYLAKYSALNLIKGFVVDRRFWGDYEGNWLRVRNHLLNGPAFGGLIGTAGSFGRLLQDQLGEASVLLGSEARQPLATSQTTSSGAQIPMTLGWHVGRTDGIDYLYKEGGGGGFHSEMRLYPTKGFGSVVMVNATKFDSTGFLTHADRPFRAPSADDASGGGRITARARTVVPGVLRPVMKAVVQRRYGPPDVLGLDEIDRPMPADGEVLVRVRAASVNPADWHSIRGRPFLVRLVGYGFLRPTHRTPGTDVAGVIEAVGANVTTLKPGDEVFGWARGSYAEFAIARADRLTLKPRDMTFEQAASVPTAAVTALQGLRDRGHLVARQHVLVIGASGGVGTFAVQLAKAFGANVTGVCGTGNLELVRSIGAEAVIDYTREDVERSGRRYDLVFQLAGTRSPLTLRRILRPTGTLVLCSGDGPLSGLDRIALAAAVSRMGHQRLVSFVAKQSGADLGTLKAFIEAGRLRPIVDRTYPLPRTPDAIRYVEARHARGKVVIAV